MAIDAPGFTHTVRVRMIHAHVRRFIGRGDEWDEAAWGVPIPQPYMAFTLAEFGHISLAAMEKLGVDLRRDELDSRSEEHTSELQSLMRISYAVFCLKKKNKQNN